MIVQVPRDASKPAEPGKLLLSIVAIASMLLIQQSAVAAPAEKPDWHLVWSDEFDATTAGAPDPAKWNFETGGAGWGNKELETYTDRRENSIVENGMLKITALKEKFIGQDNIRRTYTSARITTKNKFTQKYGRIEARLKITRGQGLWPAFWMLGDNNESGWPQCGEIDIMENIGKEPKIVHGTVHGPGYSGKDGIGAPYTLPSDHDFADDFHLYAVEWEPAQLRFYVDNALYESLTPTNLPPGKSWVFDHPFFIILNVAVGGLWPGNPDATSKFPQSMLIDYVRCYER
jgi:beta-glucanase (GH16 family)